MYCYNLNEATKACMTTMMSPKHAAGWNCSGLLNAAALAPMATGAVEGAVEDNFASFSKDSICANDCTEAEEDWAASTASRDFSATPSPTG